MIRLLAFGVMTLIFSQALVAQDTLPPQATNPLQNASKQTKGDSAAESLVEKASLLIGYNFARDFKLQEVEIDFDQLVTGIQLAVADEKLDMSVEEIKSVMQAFERKVVREQQDRMMRLAVDNKRKGEAFLSANALKEGVKELEGGLQYLVLQEGTGDSPGVTDTVRVHYKGAHINGTEFESTTGDEPEMFKVGLKMRGFIQALPRMKVGSKWKIFVPGDLAYGLQGNPPIVGPNETVIYELELVEIVK